MSGDSAHALLVGADLVSVGNEGPQHAPPRLVVVEASDGARKEGRQKLFRGRIRHIRLREPFVEGARGKSRGRWYPTCSLPVAAKDHLQLDHLDRV